MDTFYNFVTAMPKQQDNGINRFVAFCKADADFPRAEDPAVLACYLYLKLDPEQTTGFQKLLMFYQQSFPGRFPKRGFVREDMALATINLIVTLQNASAGYRWNG